MIQLSRFDGREFYLNADMIQSVESTPDTVITLTNNVKIVVKDKTEIVIQRIIQYHRLVRNPELVLKSGE